MICDDQADIDGNIFSFGDGWTENIFFGKPAPNSPVPDELHDKAKRVLDELHCAKSWKDLKRHDLSGVSGVSDDWYELDINQQYRVYFKWDSDKGARLVQADDHL